MAMPDQNPSPARRTCTSPETEEQVAITDPSARNRPSGSESGAHEASAATSVRCATGRLIAALWRTQLQAEDLRRDGVVGGPPQGEPVGVEADEVGLGIDGS